MQNELTAEQINASREDSVRRLIALGRKMGEAREAEYARRAEERRANAERIERSREQAVQGILNHQSRLHQ